MGDMDIAAIRARIKLLSEGTSGDSYEEAAKRLKALPLYEGWDGWIMLTPDGGVLEERNGRLTPCVDPLRTSALVSGAERYPELKALLSIRPASARDCLICKGTSWVEFGDAKTRIRCGVCRALGWIDDGI
jgi:hypothetical protein